MNLVPGIAGGTHVGGAPLTTDIAMQASPELLRNAIDKAVVKIRPMATPLDQISRLGHVRDVDSMEVDYYSVDCRKGSTRVTKATADAEHTGFDDGCAGMVLETRDAGVFEVSESFGFMKDDGTMGVGYVAEKNEGRLWVRLHPDDGAALAAGTEIIRLGRAATQLDVQSPQFSVLPQKKTNFCQIFKMQIEQSMVMKHSTTASP